MLLCILSTALILKIGDAGNSIDSDVFWRRAEKTLELQSLRQDLINSKMIQKTPSVFFKGVNSNKDPILASPLFLPLCGNGKIDTKADYKVHYINSSNLPLILPKQQLDIHSNNVQGADKNYTLFIYADEECDDGNHDDLDGCSADCMHMDLWTSSCEIEFKITNNVSSNLNQDSMTYEDILYDADVTHSMIVSAADGIYSFKNLALESQGINNSMVLSHVEVELLASKTFQVTNMFIYVNHTLLILYSAKLQTFWGVNLNNNVNRNESQRMKIELLKNVSHLILPNKQKYDHDDLMIWDMNAHYNVEMAYLIVHNSTTMLYLPIEYILGNHTASDPTSLLSYCDLGGRKRKCDFTEHKNNDSVFTCDYYWSFTIGPNNTCKKDPRPADTSNRNIWGDMMTKGTVLSLSYIQIPYNMKLNITPNDVAQEDFLFFHYRYIYHPFGALYEVPGVTPRKLGAHATPSEFNWLAYYIDTSAVSDMISNPIETCGAEYCMFDDPIDYDGLISYKKSNTASIKTWNTLLDELIKEMGEKGNVRNISAIRNNTFLYNKLITNFTRAFEQITKPRFILAYQKHPLTHNVWVIRQNKIMEISKSGVIVRRQDNGKCLPVGVGLCSTCRTWAPSGAKCRPCSEVDLTSLAWNLMCGEAAGCDARQNGRRLMANPPSQRNTSITFVLRTNLTIIKTYWPNASVTDMESNLTVGNASTNTNTSVFEVTVVTFEPSSVMQNIRFILLNLTDVIQVITQPYVPISIGPSFSASTSQPSITVKTSNVVNNVVYSQQNTIIETVNAEGLSRNSIIAIVLVSVMLVSIVLFIVLIIFYRYHTLKNKSYHGNNNREHNARTAYHRVKKSEYHS